MATKKTFAIIVFVIIGFVVFNVILILFLINNESTKKVVDFFAREVFQKGEYVQNNVSVGESLDTLFSQFPEHQAIEDSQPVQNEKISDYHVTYRADTAIVKSNLRIPMPEKNISLIVEVVYNFYPSPENHKLNEIVKNINHASGRKISSLDPAMIRPNIVSNYINSLSQSEPALLNHLGLDKLSFNATVLAFKIEKLN